MIISFIFSIDRLHAIIAGIVQLNYLFTTVWSKGLVGVETNIVKKIQ